MSMSGLRACWGECGIIGAGNSEQGNSAMKGSEREDEDYEYRDVYRGRGVEAVDVCEGGDG